MPFVLTSLVFFRQPKSLNNFGWSIFLMPIPESYTLSTIFVWVSSGSYIDYSGLFLDFFDSSSELSENDKFLSPKNW